MAERNLQKDPNSMYRGLEEPRYRPEFELLDRYHAFAAEIVRLSLLGIAAFGFIYEKVLQNRQTVSHLFSISFVLFGAAAVLALGYRYLSTEALRAYIFGLREYAPPSEAKPDDRQISEVDRWLEKRRRKLLFCPWLKGLAVVCLIAAAIVLTWAFTVVANGAVCAE